MKLRFESPRRYRKNFKIYIPRKNRFVYQFFTIRCTDKNYSYFTKRDGSGGLWSDGEWTEEYSGFSTDYPVYPSRIPKSVKAFIRLVRKWRSDVGPGVTFEMVGYWGSVFATT